MSGRVMFGPIPDNRALSEEIVSQISDAIIGGALAPGDRLPPERELAGQFGVSRTVVRDAVKTLAGRGVLQVRRGAGIFVTTGEENMIGHLDTLSNVLPVQGAGLKDLFDIRRVLEAQGAEWAARRRSPHHLELLRKILDEAYSQPEDPRVLSEKDARFHVAIAEASRNLVLVRVMLTLLDLLATARRETLHIPGRAKRSLEEHERVLGEIEVRNPEGARWAMLAHLRSVEMAIPPNVETSREGDG